MFKITGGKGFHIQFENGYTVSVQFGPGNYCDNYDADLKDFVDPSKLAEKGSTTAEVAVWGPDGKMIEDEPIGAGGVTDRSTPAQVLDILNWAAAQKE